MKRRFGKWMSFLLSAVMLFSLLPATAFAAEKEIIDSVSATITLPTAGAHPVETGTPGDSSYTIIKVSFSKKDANSGILTGLEPSDTFEAGETYRINVLFRANSGFTIESDASATINGMKADYWSTIGDGWGSKYFGLEYTVPAAEEEFIDSVSATVTLPTAGAHPVETGTPGDSLYNITWVYFYDDAYNALDTSDTFEAGKTYRIFVHFKPNSGYTIDETTTATINGMDAAYWTSLVTEAGRQFSFCIDYTVPEKITNISVTAPMPVADKTPNTNGITINPAALSVSNAEWCVLKDGVGLVSVNKFTAGKTYYLIIKYDVTEGYTVSNSAAISHDLTGGEAAHNSSNKTIMIEYTVAAELPIAYTVSFNANYGSGTMDAVTGVSGEYNLPECTFTPPDGKRFKAWSVDGSEKAVGDTVTISADTILTAVWEDIPGPTIINTIHIKSIPVPVTGEIATVDGITTDTTGLTAQTVQWLTEEGVVMNSQKFEAGETYCLYVSFTVDEGYEIASDAVVTHDLAGGVFTYLNATYPWISIDYVVPGGTPKTAIDSVKLSDVTTPVLGATPDYDVTLTGTGAGIDSYDGITWWKYNSETDEWEELDEDTPFGEGKYCLVVWMEAIGGCEFTEDTEFYFGEDKLPNYFDVGDGVTCYLLDSDDYAKYDIYFTVEEDAPVDSVTYGDVDGNGSVDAADALKALQHAVRLTVLEGEAYTAANVNGDDKVDATDALLMLQYTVKLINQFPVEIIA